MWLLFAFAPSKAEQSYTFSVWHKTKTEAKNTTQHNAESENKQVQYYSVFIL